MLTEDIIKRLDELQGFEKIEFVMGNNKRVVYSNTILNDTEQEIITASCVYESNTAVIPYCSIERVVPHHAV